MQGVSINIFVKKDNKKSLAKVSHAELFGKQKEKFSALDNFEFDKMKWDKLEIPEPYYVWYRQKGFPQGKLGDQLAMMYEIKANGLENLIWPLITKGT